MVRKHDRMARAILQAYPRSFRREFGSEFVRTFRDLRIHSGKSTSRVLFRALRDVVLAAPKMRLESLMNRSKVLAAAVLSALVVASAVVGSPMLLVGILSMLALLVVIYRKHDRPISAPNDDKNRWYIWLTAGATCFAIGFITLAVDNDGGELSSVGWSIWMVSWALGLVLVIFALLLAGSTFLSRRELHRSQT